MNITDPIARVREINAKADAPALAFVELFGCQQNEADGEVLRGLLLAMGYTLTEDEGSASLVLMNTCAVRDHAEQRALGHLGQLTHSHYPGRVVVVCGCMAQQEHAQKKLKASFPMVNLVFGPGEIVRFPELLLEVLERGGRHFHVTDPTVPMEEDLPVLRKHGEKAFVSIMKGCNNFCTYCIVPHVRGRERSRQPENVLAEVREVIATGAREITLLGQNVNSYAPAPGASGIADFADLLRVCGELPGDFSLRFMTSHPKDALDKLFETMASAPKVAPYLHLPVQSGSDRILKAMNRHYNRAHYLERIARIRGLIPAVNLTSDIIVGFPGETEADFEETLSLLETVRFDSLFTFIYSPRVGTPAAEYVDDTPAVVVKARFQRLLALQKEIETAKRGKDPQRVKRPATR